MNKSSMKSLALWRILFGFFSEAALASEPFKITLDTRNTVILKTFGASDFTLSQKSKISKKLLGSMLGCTNQKKPNFASAEANVSVISKQADGITFDMSSKSASSGEKCRWMPIEAATVSAPSASQSTSSALIDVEFIQSARPAKYIVDVEVASQGSSPTIELLDKEGKTVEPIKGAKNSFQIMSGPNEKYSVKTALTSSTLVDGVCCSDTNFKQAQVKVAVRKAALIASNFKLEPYIIGGDQTIGYPYVGAILIDGALHCTGTIIGPRTILTAAHCLEGYESQYSKFTFIVGPNVVQPTFGPARLVGFEFPNGKPYGYKFDPDTLADDIAVVYLKDAVNIKPVALHSGMPDWPTLASNMVNLTFVGFGFDRVDDQMIGKGIKREGSWYINGKIEPRRVMFSIPGKNTCKGDSGGPAFLIEAGKFLQVAITSGGPKDCSYGVETRVDAYAAWLSGKIK